MNTAKKLSAPRHQVDHLFTIVLIGLFAVLSLLVAVMGIQIYQNILGVDEDNNQARASLGYITSKVRAGDTAGMVSLRVHEGVPVLIIGEEYEGDVLETRIFYHEGALWEAYDYAEEPIDFEYGEHIVSLPHFTIEEKAPGLFLMEMTDDHGNTHTTHLALRTGVE